MPLPIPSRFLPPALALAGLLLAIATFAQDESEPASLEQRVANLETRLGDQSLDEHAVAIIQRSAGIIRTEAANCQSQRKAQIATLQENLVLLRGAAAEERETDPADDLADTPAKAVEPPAGVATEQLAAFTLQIREYEQQIKLHEIEISKCNLYDLRAKNLADAALARLTVLSARRLMSQGTPSLRALREDLKDVPYAVARVAENIIARDRTSRIGKTRIAIVLITTAMAFGIGLALRRMTLGWCDQQRGRGGAPALRAVLARNASRWLHIFLAGITASVAMTLFSLPPASDLILVRLCYSVAAIGLGAMLLDWYTGPFSPGSDLLSQENTAVLIRARASALGLALGVGYTSFGGGWLTGPPSEEALVIRAVLTIFTAASLIWLVRSARQIPQMRGRLWLLRLLLVVAALGSVIADLTGYRNLSNHLLLASVGTLFAAMLLWTALWVVRETANGIVHGRSDASYRVRGWLGMRPEDASAELAWLRLILSLALWLTFFVFLISLWDSTGNAMPKLAGVVTEGFAFGEDSVVVPRDILIGLSVFGLIIAMTAWAKARLSKRWLRDMGMDRGSREALVTLGGYLGFLVAAFVGLKLAGVDFRGFAFVLTALSVGIGFGLQNVVNNFVSGLILLFERPIKSGDFVSVGDVEGFIKQIRIRSTEIESLDRRTVIVPNSELVATQVTNWVLHDPFGRLTLHVGVAYGTDVEKVREILEQVAADHSEVLSKGPAPAPRALFAGFGDSSLDFELRVWIRQIERRFIVTSDLNFAIEKAFREAGVQIPFPQRDLHVRSWSTDARPDEEPS